MFVQNDQKSTGVLPIDAAVLCPASPRRPSTASRDVAGAIGPVLKIEATTGLRLVPFLPRCCHRGCVFPAQPDGNRECADHRRQSLEAIYFQSQQPTLLLLEQAKFGLPDAEPDDSRVKDRQRLAAERVRFLLEDAA